MHLIKLSVGPKDVAALAALQAARLKQDPPLRAWTRMFPKRVEELCNGGSIYWVIGGFVRVRQRILEIREEEWDDQTPCAALVLDPELVLVEARPMKPFQGWRYFEASSAPKDLDAKSASEMAKLPAQMAEELRALGLL